MAAEAASAASAALDARLFGPGGVPGAERGGSDHGDALPPRALQSHPGISADEALRRAAHSPRPALDETPAPTADELPGARNLPGARDAKWRGVSGHSMACAGGAVWTFGGVGPDGNVHGELGRYP